MNTFPDSSGKREIAWSRLSTGFHPSTHGFTRDTVSIPVYARVYRYFLDSSQVDDPLITNRALPTISYRPIRRHLAIDALMRSPVPKASCVFVIQIHRVSFRLPPYLYRVNVSRLLKFLERMKFIHRRQVETKRYNHRVDFFFFSNVKLNIEVLYRWLFLNFLRRRIYRKEGQNSSIKYCNWFYAT